MKWFRIAAKFPKWIVAAVILFGSIGTFVAWRTFRHPPSTDGAGDSLPGSQAQGRSAATMPPRHLSAFDPKDVIACGNTLVDLRSGEILAREWLAGVGERTPNIIKVLSSERLILVLGNQGVIVPFDFDGNPKPPLAVDGKPIGAAAFAEGGHEVAFVRDGNLWRGNVDWRNSTVESPQKLTDVGYFKSEVFRSPWLWKGDFLWLETLGHLTRVNLTDGSVTREKANLVEILKGISPNRTVALVPVGLRELGIIDLESGQNSTQPTGQHVNRVLWLTENTAIVQVGQNQFGLYDHSAAKITGLFQAAEAIRELIAPSPDGKRFVTTVGKMAGYFDVAERRFQPFPMPINQVEWLSPESLLLSSDSADTKWRGVWFFGTDSKVERLTNFPVDQGQVPMLPQGHFLIKGDIWTALNNPSPARQVTRVGNLSASLRLLK